MTLSYPHRTLKSYVLRQGRMTPGQKHALEVYWPLYGLEVTEGMVPYEWSSVFGRNAPVVIEIGFGMADSLIELAQTHPDINFIGIEVHPPGVGRCLHQIHEKGIKNLKVFWADANEVLNKAIPENSLDKVFLLFPDPWPKTRHNKRRIVQTSFVDLIVSKLKPNGLFHIATDWQPYADHIYAVLEDCSALQKCDLNLDLIPRVKTKYERRGVLRKHIISDFVYRRNIP
jgi:tRNA (guanine-N7-)-methyltransferase